MYIPLYRVSQKKVPSIEIILLVLLLSTGSMRLVIKNSIQLCLVTLVFTHSCVQHSAQAFKL